MIDLIKKTVPGFELEVLEEDVLCILNPHKTEDIIICADEIFCVKENGEMEYDFDDIMVSFGRAFCRFDDAEEALEYIRKWMEEELVCISFYGGGEWIVSYEAESTGFDVSRVLRLAHGIDGGARGIDEVSYTVSSFRGTYTAHGNVKI